MSQPIRSSADDLYEMQIRRLPLRERLRLAHRIIGEAASAVSAPDRPRSLLELEGLGADLWRGMDAQDYVDELRREWDHRP
jgi:hypothetical protein